MDGDLVKLSIVDVRVAIPTAAGVEAGSVTLREDEPPHRTFQIVIGQPEARAILAGWSGSVPNRPSTWDLFVSSITLLGGRLDRAVITAVEDGRHFFAKIELEHQGVNRTLLARPSDAIALTLRAYGASLYATAPVLEAVGAASLPDN